MGHSCLQRSPCTNILPRGVGIEHRTAPAHIRSRASAAGSAHWTQQLLLSRSQRGSSEQEQRRAPRRREGPSFRRVVPEGGRLQRSPPQLAFQSLVPRAAAAASQDTDRPDDREQGLNPQQQDGVSDATRSSSSSSIGTGGTSAGGGSVEENRAGQVLGLEGQRDVTWELSRTSAALEEVHKIVRLHSRLYSAARNSDEVLWVTLRSSSLLFTALAALLVALYSDIRDPDVRAKLQRFAAEEPEQVLKRVKETDYVRLSREVGAACRNTAARVWAVTPAPVRWPAAVFTWFYALVVLLFGRPVARDLTPLWIIGPGLLSYAIWQTQVVVRVTPLLVDRTRQLALQGVAEAKALVEYAQSGRLLTDSVAGAERIKGELEGRRGEAVQLVSTRQASLAKYVGEGQLERDSRSFAEAKVEELKSGLRQWAIRRWEDFSDWWFIVSRRSRKR